MAPPDVAGLYAPKHLFVHLLGGRQFLFFSYELLDEAPPYADSDIQTRESGFGLVEKPTHDPVTWRPKGGGSSRWGHHHVRPTAANCRVRAVHP